MQFFIDSKGTTVNLISDPVYEGSTNANELVLVAPISSANQVTATFMLPIGISTAERLLTLQSSMSIGGVNYNVWRCLLDGTITEYAGTVRVQFSIYQGSSIILNTYTSSFVVSKGITPQLPNTPSENIYNDILFHITKLETDMSTKVDKVSGKGLSTNDYTTKEKNKLANIVDYTDDEIQAIWDEVMA